MAEYIEREATIELLRSLGSRDYRREKGTIQEAIKMVSFSEYTPIADVAPVRHGRWEWDTEDIYRCSNCAEKSHVKEVMGHPEWDYCPNCGARMHGDRL